LAFRATEEKLLEIIRFIIYAHMWQTLKVLLLEDRPCFPSVKSVTILPPLSEQ